MASAQADDVIAFPFLLSRKVPTMSGSVRRPSLWMGRSYGCIQASTTQTRPSMAMVY